MLKRITPSMFVALLALFVALGGTGVAATKALVGSKDIADHSIRLVDLHSSAVKELRGQRGAPGVNGTNGLPGPQGQAGPQGASGPQGPAGQRGETGATGSEGAQGPKGDQGPAGTVGSYDSLDGTPCTLHDGTAGITKLSKSDRTNGFDMGAFCITPDTFEPNDSQAGAAQISNVNNVFGTIDHPGDSDWLQLLLPQTATHVNVSNAGGLANSDDFTAELYRDGVLVATGQPNGSWPGISLNYSQTADGQPHEWKLHVTAGHLAHYGIYTY
jgi:Collagen triple helix repeat (20 copies)